MIKCVHDLSPSLARSGPGLCPVERRYRFLNQPFEIRSNSPILSGLCDRIYGAFSSGRPSEDPAVSYLLEDRADRETPFCSVDPGFDSFLCSDAGQAISFWGAQLMCDHLFRLPYLFVHAAVLESDGRALVFAGPSGSGKTTFSLALAGEGFSFFSDEFAPFSISGAEVHPFPRALLLDRTSASRLSLSGLPYFLDHQEKPPDGPPPRRYILDPRRKFFSLGSCPVPPAAIFFLSGFDRSATSGMTLPAGRGLELLIELAVNTVYLGLDARAVVDLLAGLLARVPAIALRAGPPGEKPAARAGRVRELAGGRPEGVKDLAAIARRCRDILKDR